MWILYVICFLLALASSYYVKKEEEKFYNILYFLLGFGTGGLLGVVLYEMVLFKISSLP
jgi:hypothetical protein